MLETMRLLWGGQGYSSVHHDTGRKISAHLVLSAKLRGCKRCWWRFSSSCRHLSVGYRNGSGRTKRMPNARRQNLRYIKNQKSSRKLTWNLKITCLKRKIIFQTFIFGFHVSFRGGTCQCHWMVNIIGQRCRPKGVEASVPNTCNPDAVSRLPWKWRRKKAKSTSIGSSR